MARQEIAEQSIGAGAVERPADVRLGGLGEQRRVQGSRFWRRIKAEKKAFVGLIFVAVLGVVALFGPWIAPYGPDNDDFDILMAPSRQHLMGTDSFGRD